MVREHEPVGRQQLVPPSGGGCSTSSLPIAGTFSGPGGCFAPFASPGCSHLLPEFREEGFKSIPPIFRGLCWVHTQSAQLDQQRSAGLGPSSVLRRALKELKFIFMPKSSCLSSQPALLSVVLNLLVALSSVLLLSRGSEKGFAKSLVKIAGICLVLLQSTLFCHLVDFAARSVPD